MVLKINFDKTRTNQANEHLIEYYFIIEKTCLLNIYSCEFAKAKCTDGSLSIESVSFCHHTTTTAKPTTLDPNQQLFCDNKDFIGCPTTVKHVCGSDGVVYNNE